MILDNDPTNSHNRSNDKIIMASQDKRSVVCIQTDQNMYHFFTNGSHISIRLIIASNNNKSKLNHLLAPESVWKLSSMTQPPRLLPHCEKNIISSLQMCPQLLSCLIKAPATINTQNCSLRCHLQVWVCSSRNTHTLFFFFYYFHYMLTPHSLPPFPSVTLHWQQDLELSSVIPIVCPHR